MVSRARASILIELGFMNATWHRMFAKSIGYPEIANLTAKSAIFIYDSERRPRSAMVLLSVSLLAINPVTLQSNPDPSLPGSWSWR
jgi:hypothetical protein